ncbi:MAG: helix-turn-helix domain-containing protein [Prevotella sp.]|nr:helix-turn-helix domain-containing protein [Prevotella sp.]
MYTLQSLQDPIFLMLYGGVAMLAMLAGIYLWLTRSLGIDPDFVPPRTLRRWTAAFMITASLSHVWWYVLGVYWLTDSRLMRDIMAIALDHILLVPLVMAMLLRMLQDCRRRLWPWAVVQIPTAIVAVEGIVTQNADSLDIMHYWQIAVIISFIIYYIYALFQYGRWLRENYADLEHKEVWQSLVFVVALFVVYEIYSTNPGVMSREYLAQFNTIAIVVFLLWRVETLQELEAVEAKVTPQQEQVADADSPGIPSNIPTLLVNCCEKTQLYLQHDLTLTQLAEKLGTNRTYLGQYFVQQNMTYNTYINRLRIDHFEHLYQDSIARARTITAQQLAFESGFRSYSTFAAAFKQLKGQTATEWMRQQTGYQPTVSRE